LKSVGTNKSFFFYFCPMRRLSAFSIAFLLVTASVRAQTSADEGDVWSLQRSVQYAIEHNISIKQSVLNAKLAKYTLVQSQLSQLPNANVNTSYGRSFGRSINPATNQFVDAG